MKSDDEQKARFNAVAPTQEAASAKDKRDLVAFCTRMPGVTDLPLDRIAEAVQPRDSQRAAFDALQEVLPQTASSAVLGDPAQGQQRQSGD